LKRSHRDRIHHADDERKNDDYPGLHRAGRQKNDEQRWAQHLDRMKCRDHAATVGAVGQYAADQRKDLNRRGDNERIKPDHERRSTQAEQQPRLGDLLSPGADVGEQARKPERAETPCA
jgi:hypothetical protein